jgi:hypothetical protein
MATRRDWADLGERTVSTLLQAGLVESGIFLLDAPQWVLIPVIGAVTAVKAYFAQKFGNRTSAALPRDLERI